jgi:intracellular septation protein
MQLFLEIFPVLLFFLAFKIYGIYVATIVGIVATGMQALTMRLWQQRWDKKLLITFGVFVVFGSMTLYFHNPIFIKWKPTIIFWIFAIVIVGSRLFMREPIMQRIFSGMLQDKCTVPVVVWYRLNVIWALFFIGLGALNLYIAYYFDDNAWVNFKFYGITSALFLISIIQAFYLTRYMIESKQ